MTTNMKAKARITNITQSKKGGEGEDKDDVVAERITFSGVAKDGSYPSDGSDEDNTFAKFSPSFSVDLTIANPALIGAYKGGETFYIRFEEIDPVAKADKAE